MRLLVSLLLIISIFSGCKKKEVVEDVAQITKDGIELVDDASSPSVVPS